MTMRFKNYVWPFGPETVRVCYARRLAELGRANAGAVVQNMGGKSRVVAGGGTFAGETCAQEFEKLSALLAESDSGMLKLTGMEPFPAYFSSLEMDGEAGPDSIRYRFTFLEDARETQQTAGGTFLCEGGETLWSIAARYSTTADRLRALNPALEWPNDLPAGTEVLLP